MITWPDVMRHSGSLLISDKYKLSKDEVEASIVDMFEKGIIDPVKVTRSGVQNASSAAAVLITTSAAVADAPEENKGPDMPMGGGMPGGMPGMM